MNTDKIFTEAIANEYAPKKLQRFSTEMIAAVIEECVRPVDGTQGRVYSEMSKNYSLKR